MKETLLIDANAGKLQHHELCHNISHNIMSAEFFRAVYPKHRISLNLDPVHRTSLHQTQVQLVRFICVDCECNNLPML